MTCDGCGAATSLEHALDCKKGGLVTQHHNEVRDVIGDLASVVFKEVVKEPVVQEANDAECVPSLMADLSIRGVWQPQTMVLFDVRVTDTGAPSHSILTSAEEEKKKKYSEAATLHRASFTPLVVSVDRVLGREAKKKIVKRHAQKLAHKWEKSNSEVLGWMRARLSFAILRATNLYLRGSRTKWRSAIGLDDGAGLPSISGQYLCRNVMLNYIIDYLIYY